MHGITLTNSLQNHPQTGAKGSRGDAVILLGAVAGALCVLLGFLLFGVFILSGETNALENYAGVVLLVAAFVFFGFAAHFMDESDARERRRKRIRIEKFKQDNFTE